MTRSGLQQCLKATWLLFRGIGVSYDLVYKSRLQKWNKQPPLVLQSVQGGWCHEQCIAIQKGMILGQMRMLAVRTGQGVGDNQLQSWLVGGNPTPKSCRENNAAVLQT